jgi:hypothetical protein
MVVEARVVVPYFKRRVGFVPPEIVPDIHTFMKTPPPVPNELAGIEIVNKSCSDVSPETVVEVGTVINAP